MGSFQIYRLITSPFATYTIAELIFSFLSYLSISAEQEKRQGTLKTIIDFLVKSVEINIVFLVMLFVLSLFHPYLGNFQAYGLWGLFMFKLAENFIDNPEGSVPLFGLPVQIPTKFYPLAVLIIFSIISNSIRFDIIAGFVAGFIHIKFLEVIIQQHLNDRKIATWENSSIVEYIRTLPHYVSMGAMAGPTFISTYDNAYDNSMVREAGSPAGFNDQAQDTEAYGGTAKKYDQFGAHDVEDLTQDIEKP